MRGETCSLREVGLWGVNQEPGDTELRWETGSETFSAGNRMTVFVSAGLASRGTIKQIKRSYISSAL